VGKKKTIKLYDLSASHQPLAKFEDPKSAGRRAWTWRPFWTETPSARIPLSRRTTGQRRRVPCAAPLFMCAAWKAYPARYPPRTWFPSCLT